MKTANLIETLAANAGPTRPVRATLRIVTASLAGAAATLVLLLTWLGTRSMGEAMGDASFWMKAGYTLALSLAGLMLVRRLARPGGRPGAETWMIGLAVAAMMALAGRELARAGPGQMPALWLGHTWASCSLHILALAAPVFAGAAWGLRRLAPTRLALAGAAAGLLAGGVGATVYGLYCDETAATFVTAWYTIGIGVCAGLGALAGPRLLRW